MYASFCDDDDDDDHDVSLYKLARLPARRERLSVCLLNNKSPSAVGNEASIAPVTTEKACRRCHQTKATPTNH